MQIITVMTIITARYKVNLQMSLVHYLLSAKFVVYVGINVDAVSLKKYLK